VFSALVARVLENHFFPSEGFFSNRKGSDGKNPPSNFQIVRGRS
jgi:hypothetical protein